MRKIPEELKDVLVSTPDTVSGAIRFAGTRVMVEVFLDSVAEGLSVDEILEHFPSIPRDGAMAVLEYQNRLVKGTLGIENEAA